MKVGFLGLGTMGAPMAANVLARGHELTVWNRTASRAGELVAKGARLAATPGGAAGGAEVVVTMLADPAAVEAVMAGADGVLAALSPGAVVVDCSTVDPATARALDERVRAHGGCFLDAPVSGTRKPATDGTLVILAGGPDDVLARARPVLDAMGRVRHLGPVGHGMAMKLVLNGLGAHMLTGFTAMLALGARQGLSARAMLDVISAGAFSSPLFAGKGERILSRDFRPDFTLALMLKDQDLVLATARSLDYPMPTEQAIRDLLATALTSGLADQDLSALIQLFESWTHTPVT